MGRDRSVGIATRYGMDGPGIASRWFILTKTTVYVLWYVYMHRCEQSGVFETHNHTHHSP